MVVTSQNINNNRKAIKSYNYYLHVKKNYQMLSIVFDKLHFSHYRHTVFCNDKKGPNLSLLFLTNYRDQTCIFLFFAFMINHFFFARPLHVPYLFSNP